MINKSNLKEAKKICDEVIIGFKDSNESMDYYNKKFFVKFNKSENFYISIIKYNTSVDKNSRSYKQSAK